jgi:hypothetical protein
MLRKRLLALSVFTTIVMAGSFSSSTVSAQEVLDLDAAPAAAAGGGEIDLDQGGQAQSGPVVAGQMSEAMAAAKRQFDQKKWLEASIGLRQVVDGQTGDDEGNRQLAQFYLASSLYNMKFYQASYAIFSVIADNTYHLKFSDTLPFLAMIATQLPEPADVVARVGKYGDADLAKFDNTTQKEMYWHLNYLLARYRYRNGQYQDAIRLFQRVGTDSEYYVSSQFFSGISFVQLRKSVPAVESFQRVEKALAAGAKGVEDSQRLRDLSYLSMARTLYSSSIKLNPEDNTPLIEAKNLSAAVKYWNMVDQGSEYWLDALFEESWAYFLAGDYPRAFGNIHTIEAPYFPNAFYPEAEVLKAVIYFYNCDYQKAITVVARFNEKYIPIRDSLQKTMKKFEGANQDEAFFKFLVSVHEGTAILDDASANVIEGALSDRQLLRNLEYVKVLDAESERLKKAPPTLRSADVGMKMDEDIKLARELAVKRTGELARARFQRAVSEMEEHLRNGEKILIDIVAAQRNLLDKELKAGQVTTAQAMEFGVVKPDEEHILWPFDGEYWRDELGYYRQVVMSACGR